MQDLQGYHYPWKGQVMNAWILTYSWVLEVWTEYLTILGK